MKRLHTKIGVGLIAGLLFCSCAKHEILQYGTEKPESIIAQENIDTYSPLISYIDKNAHPNFKWGVALNMDDYLNKGVMYRLANRNFEEMVMGYEMKHASIVQADGTLNLSKLERVIKAAQENNMALFGHTLTWHSGQNATYLNSLIAPVLLPPGSAPVPGGINVPSLSGYALKMTNPSVANAWEAQTAFDPKGLEDNTEYTLKITVRGSKAGNIGLDLQETVKYTGDSFGSIAFTTDYKEYELKVKTTAARTRFIINFGQFAGTVFIDNISLKKAGSNVELIPDGDFEKGISGWIGWGNSSTRSQSAVGEGYGGPGGIRVEKTPDEKKRILTEALETFIAGMMSVTKNYVKAWDVVNEPMSDWPDQYALKTGIGKTDLAEDEFYWQDYLGKDYAVKAIQLARKYGNPNDILFINDYGLEGGGNKCKGLIAYVNYVESKGAKVDGIGTQMHINSTANKDDIVNMYKLLAATGKLIKVSELDIGLGDNIKTANATAAMYQQQADMYKFVIEKYFEIIPKAQQYGITIWSPLDSPDRENSFWRRGEPIGIWTESFVRKPAYQAVAEALQKQK
ncbi:MULTISPECIES: endo-1,4-beta-xylanase [unclassified Sphingobacterium]|uniref:endo-1,4-beta-xylanase n=1 Tax=unclassified Sphingobacterium TaxID=2609468 RepID=UPI00143AB3C4|nr:MULTISPECIES: endo-1,4-beta-xylanase [unclassified Sphingobacterium]NJI72367.1 endo-1,4-beta-xylanase [Sphingobacterium sp. B16(2022)]QQD12409.1 endo-1,4-beta-xylanase [Sphingobacterium sp. UDSM-2020]